MMKFWVSILLVGVMAIGCSDRSPEAALSRAKEAAEAGNWRDAYTQLQRLEKSGAQNLRVLLFLALAAEKCGEPDRAIDAANRAVKLNDQSFTAKYTLGRLYSQIPERRNEAKKLLLEAYRLNPKSPDVLIQLGNLALATGDNQGAAVYLNQLKGLGHEQDPMLFNDLAISYANRQKYREARAAFLRAEKYAPESPEICLNAARFYDYCLNLKSDAIERYQRFIKLTDGKSDYQSRQKSVAARLAQLKKGRR